MDLSSIVTSISSQLPVRWEIHELPVDLSVDAKLRCNHQYVGRFMQYSGEDKDYIYGVTTASLILRSLVLFVNNESVSCGSIIPLRLPDFIGRIAFKSGVFGEIVIAQWESEYSVDV